MLKLNTCFLRPERKVCRELFRFRRPHFKTTNEVIVVDLPGFGRSDFLRPTLALYARWLERLIDGLQLARSRWWITASGA